VIFLLKVNVQFVVQDQIRDWL